MKPVLWQISYSPWSERARWALEAAGIDYERRSYQPLLGELALRRLRNDGKPASVPVLVLDDRVIADSAEIARWAAGDGPLRPDSPRDYDALVERGLAAGRVLALSRVLDDRDALLEMTPKWMRALGPVASAIAAIGVRRTLSKYGSPTPAEARETLVAVLDRIRADLAAAPPGDPQTLCGRFTLHDIALAQVLAFVDPPTSGLRIGEGNRQAFRDPELSDGYADLLAWRDALYRKHRGP